MADEAVTIVKVPIAKCKDSVDVDTRDPREGGDLPAEVYTEALIIGLKEILSRGLTKVTKTQFPDDNTLRAEAMKVVQDNLNKVREGKIRFMASKARGSKASGAVMTEARRMARAMVKEMMKREKIKISQVKASDITKAANALIEANPSLIEEAKAEIERRNAVEAKVKGFDISALKAIADSTPAEAKPLSAKQAAGTKHRAKATA